MSTTFDEHVDGLRSAGCSPRATDEPGGAGRPAHEAHPTVRTLAVLVDELAHVAEDAESWAAVEVLSGVLSQVDRLTAVAMRLLATVESDGLWATEGARSLVHWLAASTGMTYGRARGLVVSARALRDSLPLTAEAALAGEVSADQVQVLARVAPTTQARRAALAAPESECGEAFLLAEATTMPADSFGRLVRRWAAAADPEADERGYREACDREFLALSPTTGGYHLAGFLTTEHGAAVGAALDAVMAAPAAGDTRTTQQRRAQALSDVARLVLDHGLAGTGAAVRPHLNVVVDFETLRRAVARADGAAAASDGSVAGIGEVPTWPDRPGSPVEEASDGPVEMASGSPVEMASGGPVEMASGGPVAVAEVRCRSDGERGDAGAAFRRGDGHPDDECRFRLAPVADVERFAVAEVLGAGPIPRSVLARLACDGELSRVVFGPESQVIDAGRSERVFSGPRRRAVVARDGTCRYPGCTAPPALGEIHHVAEWVRDHGDTDVNLGILLCWYHHDLVHRLRIEIRRSPTGGWLFLTRHGTPVVRAV